MPAYRFGHASRVLAVVLATLGAAEAARAQTTATSAAIHTNPAYAGDCAVVVTLSGQRAGDVITVLVGHGALSSVSVSAAGQATVDVPTGAPLQKDDGLELLVNNSSISGAGTTVLDSARRPPGVKPTGTCAKPLAQALAEQEESLIASAYYGGAFDRFAPASVGGYPPGTAAVNKSRQLFGVDFDYRLAGRDASSTQFWLAGETLHGVRVADIDCTAEANKPPICDPTNGISYARAVLQNQSSLEAYVAPRLEFSRIQEGTSAPSRFYVTGRLGFLAIDEAPRVYRNHHAAVGLKIDDGVFKGSMLEAGWGCNELLSGARWKRLKVDGLVTFDLQNMPLVRTDKARLFIEMFIDNDLGGNTPDSIQTFLGISVDIRKFFGG